MSDLISRDDVIALWDKYHYEIATKAIEFDKELRQLQSAEPKMSKWIPCSERLPEEDYETGKGVQYSDFVLMSVEHKGDEETIVDYGHTVDGKWYSDYTDCFISQEWKVTAWMQLPEPYRGDRP